MQLKHISMGFRRQNDRWRRRVQHLASTSSSVGFILWHLQTKEELDPLQAVPEEGKETVDPYVPMVTLGTIYEYVSFNWFRRWRTGFVPGSIPSWSTSEPEEFCISVGWATIWACRLVSSIYSSRYNTRFGVGHLGLPKNSTLFL